MIGVGRVDRGWRRRVRAQAGRDRGDLSSNHVNPRCLELAAASAIGWSCAGVGVVRRRAHTSRRFPREIRRCTLSTRLRPSCRVRGLGPSTRFLPGRSARIGSL